MTGLDRRSSTFRPRRTRTARSTLCLLWTLPLPPRTAGTPWSSSWFQAIPPSCPSSPPSPSPKRCEPFPSSKQRTISLLRLVCRWNQVRLSKIIFNALKSQLGWFNPGFYLGLHNRGVSARTGEGLHTDIPATYLLECCCVYLVYPKFDLYIFPNKVNKTVC